MDIITYPCYTFKAGSANLCLQNWPLEVSHDASVQYTTKLHLIIRTVDVSIQLTVWGIWLDIQFNPLNSKYLWGKLKNISAFLSFINMEEMAHFVEMIVHGRKKAELIFHSQYHGCWWPGSFCRQVSSIHGIDLVFPEYSILSTKRVS